MAIARWLETDTYSNKDISAAVSIGAYTADADRFVLPQLLIDQAAGNGDYVYYVTLQVGGAGSSYIFGPKTVAAAASGETAIGSQGSAIFVRSGDVLTVYVDGLAGDTSTPDTIVRWAEMAALRPTTADRTLAVDESGNVVASNALDAAGTRSALGMAAANLDEQLGTLATAAALATVDGNVDAVLEDTALIEEIKAITDALDVTAVTLVATSNAGEITIKRTLNLVAVVSGLTIPADWTACYWTVKRSTDDLDADALVQILVSNPGDPDDGVQVLMGTALEDESDGSLVVNQALGTVTIALDDASTAALEDAVELVWDVKVHAPGAKTQPGAGTATITTTVTRT